MCLKLQEAVQGFSKIVFPVIYLRSFHETSTVIETMRKAGEFFRDVKEKADIESEVKAGWVFFTRLTDTAQVTTNVIRGLILCVRIMTTALVRDFVLRRFLKARSELEIKSCVTREIILESKIR
jgi:hypothetical protein